MAGLSTKSLRLIDGLAPGLLTRPAAGSEHLYHITPAELQRLIVAARQQGREEAGANTRRFVGDNDDKQS